MLRSRKKVRNLLLIAGAILAILFLAIVIVVNRFVEPLLRNRLHTLIVQGSDSLYRYKLESLNANFFGGNVELKNMQLRVDSAQYRKLAAANALPALIMQFDLQKGEIRGLGVFALLFGKRIEIKEIISREADVKLSRSIAEKNPSQNPVPLWKLMQPTLKSISIDRINLDGVKLLYKHADTAESIKLQFDRCEALFEDIRIDSAASADTARIAFIKEMRLRFSDLKFRTPDSTYKMKAEDITYSSRTKTAEIKEFKLQTTLKKDAFYKAIGHQKDMYYLEVEKVKFTNLQLDRFIHSNKIIADSVVLSKPDCRIYSDRTLPAVYQSKIGNYPHQILLKAKTGMMIKALKIEAGKVTYTEKAEKTRQEGILPFTQMNAVFSNVTNDPEWIKRNGVCTGNVQANLFNTSPLQAQFQFFLDSAEGAFRVSGQVQQLTAAQLNQVAIPLANTELPSASIPFLRFAVWGDNFRGTGNLQMRYSNLVVILRKRDKETGRTETQRFLTKILNRFTIWPDNPGPDGVERSATNVVYARPSNKGFFAVVWKTIFAGMQNVMMKSGRYE